jgi:hypothetical protein
MGYPVSRGGMKLGGLFLLLSLTPLLAQQPGTVSGKVVNSVTGQPVKKAVVTLRAASGQSPYVARSDESGKFLFDNVQPANYVATALADGYSEMRTIGRPVAVAAQQLVEHVEVRVAPLAAISGKVLDEDGQPMAGVSVGVTRDIYTSSGKRLQIGSTVQTDDRGVYRLFDLQPGRYYLMAFIVNNGTRPEQKGEVHSTVPEEGYAPVYYPGVAELSQASLQELPSGAEWAGADFKLRRLPTYHIRGHVTGATGRVSVLARPCEHDEWEMPLTPVDLRVSQLPNARFDISGAMFGNYCLSVLQNGPGIPASQTVTVKAADVDDIELAVPPAFPVSGVVTFDGVPPSPMPPIDIGLISTGAVGSGRSRIKSDGSFQIAGVSPGALTLLMPRSRSLYVKSAWYGNLDVTSGSIPSLEPGTALRIVMGTDAGEIDGTVQPGNVDLGMPVLVAALPEEAFAAREDMQRQTTGPAGGSFTLSNMPPGNYKVFALQTEDFSEMYNPELMKLLEGKAASVTVSAAGHEQVSVTAVSIWELEQALEKLK